MKQTERGAVALVWPDGTRWIMERDVELRPHCVHVGPWRTIKERPRDSPTSPDDV